MQMRLKDQAAESAAQTIFPAAAPAVLATSRLCEVMELAAMRLMRAQLPPGECSISVAMNLRHVAGTRDARGLLRAAVSQHLISGRTHRFIVNAFDERGLVAVCEHTRVVVAGATQANSRT
jgi:predicted thioesterase